MTQGQPPAAGQSGANPVPLVILNPTANRGKMSHHRQALTEWMQRSGAEYAETQKRGDAQTLAHMAGLEGRPIIVVGGDGTVHEAANGLLEVAARVPMGIIPAGSGNDFACQTLGLPKDIDAALERAFSGALRTVDAGMVNGHFFVNSFSAGLDGDIALAASRLKRYPLMEGEVLYYTAALRQLLFGYGRCPWLRYGMDGGEESAASNAEQSPQSESDTFKRYVLIAVTNGPTYGAGFRINPRADPQDGLFDICAVRYTPLLRALNLLPVVRKGEHEGLPEVRLHRATAIHIETRTPVTIQMDGETAQGSIFDVRNLPGALTVRV